MKQLWQIGVVISVLSACATYPDGVLREDVVRINTQLGVEYFRRGQLNLALENLRKALAADSNYAPAHSTIALVYARQAEFDLADTHFKEAIDQVSPKLREYGDVHNNYGAFLCNRGHYQGAEEHFLLAIGNRAYTTKEAVYENAGVCAAAGTRMVKAEVYFRKALQINARLPRSLFQMAQLQFHQTRYLKTRAYIQRFHEIISPTAASLWLGLKAEKSLGDTHSVEKFAATLIADFPDSDETEQYRQLN